MMDNIIDQLKSGTQNRIHLTSEKFDEFESKLEERNDIAAHQAKRLMKRKRRWNN